MGSIGNPKTWIPYMNSKDCSQGFCSLYCPQWCYIIFPPPPPFEFPDDDSSPNFSPLVIAIIGILASAFLLVSYYTIISKYCGNRDSRRRENLDPNAELDNNQNPTLHEPWHVLTAGLDEALIKSITVCKYKKGDGLIEGTDCSVCLSEFEEDENLRLLPKCSHAFHVQCIDTWLRSHSNCPLCRANIIFIGASPLQLPPPATETPPGNDFNESLPDDQERYENAGVSQDIEMVVGEVEIMQNDGVPKTPFRAFSDLGHLQGRERDTIIEITDEGYQHMRRSISMDHSCQSRVSSVSEILHMNQVENLRVEVCGGDAGSSKGSSADDISKCSHRKGVLHSVMNHVAMKRSFSSGRFLLTRQGRVRETTVPL